MKSASRYQTLQVTPTLVRGQYLYLVSMEQCWHALSWGKYNSVRRTDGCWNGYGYVLELKE